MKIVEQFMDFKNFNPATISALDKQLFSLNSTDCQLMEIDKEKRTAKFVAVPTQITIDGRAVFVPGVDLKEFDARNTILWHHAKELLIGRSLWSKKEKNKDGEMQVIVKVEFMPDDMGQYVYENVRDGWFKFVSPGLMPVESYYGEEAEISYKEDYGRKPKTPIYYYGRKTMMYELSIEHVPAWSGATQKMNLNGMPEKMKNVLAFEALNDYNSRIGDLENKFSTLAGTLGSVNPKAGDGEKPLGKKDDSSWDVSKIDMDYCLSIFNKHLKGDS